MARRGDINLVRLCQVKVELGFKIQGLPQRKKVLPETQKNYDPADKF